MTDTTIPNMNDIASNGGVQSGDLFYVARPGTPDADFKADADDILAFVESTATNFAAASHTHLLSEITDAGSLAALNDVGTAQLQNDAVTYAKIQDVTATDKLLGRASSGSGIVEEITCTAAARGLLDDVSAAAMRTTLGLSTAAATGSYADLAGTPALGALAAKSSVDLSSSDATGTLAASRFPALSGDVTTSAGSLSSTIASNTVTNAKAAQMATNTIKGNNTGSTANATDLTVTQVTAMLNNLVGDSGSGGTKGLVPAPSAGDAAAGKYLKANGTWATVSGGSGLQPHVQVMTSSGTFTTSANITASTMFKIRLVGGGASGAGFYGSGSYGGGGGSAGGTCIVWVSGLSASTGYTVTIGAGGTGVSNNTTGNAGGASSIVIGATTYTANGGTGGVNNNAAKEGVVGGTSSNGTINLTGGYSTNCDGGFSGGGGNSTLGMGGMRRLASGGSAGVGYGSGGSGSGTGGGTSGAGAQGICIIEWCE